MKRLYNAALLPVRWGLSAWGRWQMLATTRGGEWRERLARTLPAARPGGVWIHGSSVGEARVVRSLSRGLREARPALPLAASSMTATGRAELPEPPEVDAAFFVPFDFPGLPARVLGALRPAALVLVETELWPNLLDETDRAGAAVVVVNGRLSEARMASYRRLGRLYRPLLSRLAAVAALSSADAARFRELGVPPEAIEVTGNVKYDLPPPEVAPEAWRRRLGLALDRPVFVAGSTARGEDAAVLDAFRSARAGRPALMLVLAPRHPERSDEVERLVRAEGWRVVRLSSEPSAAEADVLLVDAVGPLRELYGIAGAAFVGGSLAPRGGHNVLEPAAAGVPVLFGPHTQSFAEPAAALVAAGGAVRVRDAADLGRAVGRILGDDEAARRLVAGARGVLEANRGALGRSLRLVESVLARRSATPPVEAAR